MSIADRYKNTIQFYQTQRNNSLHGYPVYSNYTQKLQVINKDSKLEKHLKYLSRRAAHYSQWNYSLTYS